MARLPSKRRTAESSPFSISAPCCRLAKNGRIRGIGRPTKLAFSAPRQLADVTHSGPLAASVRVELGLAQFGTLAKTDSDRRPGVRDSTWSQASHSRPVFRNLDREGLASALRQTVTVLVREARPGSKGPHLHWPRKNQDDRLTKTMMRVERAASRVFRNRSNEPR